MIKVEIDPHSGFCPGVIRAIDSAENFLSTHERLYSLGDIVHNGSELERLGALGLVPLDEDDLDEMTSAAGETVLIRAHGQPPRVYGRLRGLGFDIIDCTCPVVLNIQKRIASAEGQVLIFGKKGHPEVLGLLGQNPRAVVFESVEELDALLPDIEGPLEVFSQTTMSPVEYAAACGKIRASHPGAVLHETICAQVRSRHSQLQEFARTHDVVVFVAGRNSSNGRVLSGICREANVRTLRVKDETEIDTAFFRSDDCVGVCGATSTPRWLLEKVAAYIGNLQ